MGGPIRVLHGADLHLGLRRYGTASPTAAGNSRIDDAIATLDRFADTAIEQDVDLAVLAGDTFDSRTPSPVALGAVSRTVARIRAAGIPLIVDPGNHDGPEIVGDPYSHTLSWLRSLALADVWVPVVPEQRRIETHRGPIDVTAMPYPHKRALDAELEGVPPDLRVMEAARRVDALIEALKPDPQREVPALFVGHLTVTGSKLGSERLMRAGWDVSIDATLLDLWDYAALGHIHSQQRVSQRVYYAGSMEYVDHAEGGQKKGWLLAQISAGEVPNVEQIPSGARPIGLLDIEQTPDGELVDTSPASWYAAGPIIRVRLFCAHRRPTAGQQDRITRGLLDKGASFVDAEIVLSGEAAEYRATRPEVDAAVATVLAESAGDEATPRSTVADLSMTEALRVWLTANGKPLEPALTLGTQLIAAQTAGRETP